MTRVGACCMRAAREVRAWRVRVYAEASAFQAAVGEAARSCESGGRCYLEPAARLAQADAQERRRQRLWQQQREQGEASLQALQSSVFHEQLQVRKQCALVRGTCAGCGK